MAITIWKYISTFLSCSPLASRMIAKYKIFARNKVNSTFNRMVEMKMSPARKPNLTMATTIERIEMLKAMSVRYRKTCAFRARLWVLPLMGKG